VPAVFRKFVQLIYDQNAVLRHSQFGVRGESFVNLWR